MTDTSFYESSANVLAQCNGARENLDALLDPESGYAPRLSRMCKQKISQIVDSGMEFSQQDELLLLKQESNTWDLLQALMSFRKTEGPLPPTAHELLRDNPFTPTATLAQSIMKHSPLLNELVIVREWLHDCAPAPIIPEAANGYWKFTKHRLTQAQRTGNRKDVETLVQELDPDAVNRDDVRVLAADDANYEKQLAHSLYSFVRAGRLADAIELCRRAQRPWRAASIRGSLLFQWRLLSYDCDDPSMALEDVGWSGNKQRRLWKSTCTRAALNTALSDPDRALYASLAPSPATSVVLKGACRTWADHLWAQVSIICEGKQVDELARVNGGFWEGGMPAVELITKMKAAGDEPEPEELEKENAEWKREVFGSMESLKNVLVSEGPPANDPYHASQLHIILNQTDKLLEDFAKGLQIGEFNPEQPNFTALTRFFAHLCLFLRLIDVPVPHTSIQIILEVYLQVLEEADQREHIALYASALGENAVDRYAVFLANLDVSTSVEDRRIALHRAEDHGLDVIRVAQVTAEKTVYACFTRLPAQRLTLPSIVTRESKLSNDEQMLIRSIEWTTFLEETYVNALEQSNVIFRYFLENGKLRAAETLLSMLPPGVRSVDAPQVHRIEFAHYMQFFEIWDALEQVTAHQAAESSYTTKGAKSIWLNDLKELVKNSHTKIEDLLTCDWLISHGEIGHSNNFRTRSLSHIRQIYIPELIIRLHTLLMNTGSKISSNYAEAMKLANIVADSRFSLYDDFLTNNQERLWEYLHSIHQCLLQGLANGEDHGEPFWFMVSSTHS